MIVKNPLHDMNLLYIEDDLDLLETNKIIFSTIFKSVTAFSEASEALETFLRSQSSYDIVICDLRMPDMDGIEFYRCLRSANPKIPFALMSGEVDLGQLIATLPLKESIIALPKPCRKTDIMKKILERL